VGYVRLLPFLHSKELELVALISDFYISIRNLYSWSYPCAQSYESMYMFILFIVLS